MLLYITILRYLCDKKKVILTCSCIIVKATVTEIDSIVHELVYCVNKHQLFMI